MSRPIVSHAFRGSAFARAGQNMPPLVRVTECKQRGRQRVETLACGHRLVFRHSEPERVRRRCEWCPR